MTCAVTLCLVLASFNEACGQNCPPESRGTAEAGGFKETSAIAGGYIIIFIIRLIIKERPFIL